MQKKKPKKRKQNKKDPRDELPFKTDNQSLQIR